MGQIYSRKLERIYLVVIIGLWQIRCSSVFGKYKLQIRFHHGIEFNKIFSVRFDLTENFLWEEVKIRGWYYKNTSGTSSLSITFTSLFTQEYYSNKRFIFLWFIMTHSQLMGVMGDTRNGEGLRKRLKISVPHFDNSVLIKTFSKCLIGRCTNPDKQEMKALLTNLPKIWKLEKHVTGKDLGLGKFQFDFEKEEDIEGVLKLQPYHFHYWMIMLARWQPKKSQHYPSEIPFWVRVLGVPTEFRTVPTFESIGVSIGRLIEVDLDHMRVLVVVDAFKELCFETTVDFNGGEFYDGEEAYVSLRYQKLFGYCKICGSLCHNDEKCPLDKKCAKQSPDEKKENREDHGGWFDGAKHDDRAISYKGVVVNGKGGHQNREREGRDYYGKGKMVEETDSKWVKVADRGNRRAPGHRGNYRGDGEASRYRSSRREDVRSSDQVEHTRVSPGNARAQHVQQQPHYEAQEEGEIMAVGEDNKTPPSHGFQEQLLKTQAEGPEAVSNPIDTENGLQQLQCLVENQVDTWEEEVLEWDEIKATCREHGFDLDKADDLPDLSEEEAAAATLALEDHTNLQNMEEQLENEEDKEPIAGEEAKKQVPRNVFLNQRQARQRATS